ncbi:hypothetical protein OSTOST_24585, partial [Ostertagia ostertagi]
IPTSFITVTDASTDKKYNQQQNGGTQGADVHGRAIMACCEKLMVGLRPILKEEPDWRKAVLKAYKMRVPLQASEHIGRKHGIPLQSSMYNATGAACIILSVDIVMDVGRNLNPAIDICQIEGALMMSYSSLTFEKVTYDDKGKVIENTFSLYKLPSPSVTPMKFRVKLLKETDCTEEEDSFPKDIGEPLMMLGVGTYASLRYAITARRRDLGYTKFFEIAAPLTAAKIISYCNP